MTAGESEAQLWQPGGQLSTSSRQTEQSWIGRAATGAFRWFRGRTTSGDSHRDASRCPTSFSGKKRCRSSGVEVDVPIGIDLGGNTMLRTSSGEVQVQEEDLWQLSVKLPDADVLAGELAQGSVPSGPAGLCVSGDGGGTVKAHAHPLPLQVP